MDSSFSNSRAKSPGKSHRQGISLFELAEMFPDEAAAQRWFESWHWPDGEIACMRCGSVNAYRVKTRKPMPYRCRDCRKVLFAQDEHGDGGQQSVSEEVGICDLLGDHESQGCE